MMLQTVFFIGLCFSRTSCLGERSVPWAESFARQYHRLSSEQVYSNSHVFLFPGYTPNSNSFSPPRINTQSRLNGSGPISSHASSPLHPSLHQSPYSHLSSSFVQRDFLNGSTPHYSPGGASSCYHANSNGVTNGMSPYQAVGGVSESYLANGNISVHMTPPTRDYSSKPHPTTENSGARRSVQPPFRTGTCTATSTWWSSSRCLCYCCKIWRISGIEPLTTCLQCKPPTTRIL